MTTSDALSPRLRSLLAASPRDEDVAISEIAGSSLMLEQVQGMLEHLRNVAARPAEEMEIRRLIVNLFAIYPQPTRADAEWSSFWAPYVETLEGVCAPAIEAALKTWVADPKSEFLPKPGRLRELAMTVRNPATSAFYIAAKAIRKAEERAKMDSRPQLARHEIQALPELSARAMPTEESRASVRAMAAQFRAQVEERRPERPVLPPTPVTFAPGLHVTEAMAAHLRRKDPDFGARDDGGPTLWPAEDSDPGPEMFS